MRKWRLAVLLVFVFSLVSQLVCLYFLSRAALNPGESPALVGKILSLYSAPGGTMLAAVFVREQRKKGRGGGDEQPQAWTVWVALGVALIWNALLVGPYVLWALNKVPDYSTKDLGAMQDAVSGYGGWLTSGMLVYLYGK